MVGHHDECIDFITRIRPASYLLVVEMAQGVAHDFLVVR